MRNCASDTNISPMLWLFISPQLSVTLKSFSRCVSFVTFSMKVLSGSQSLLACCLAVFSYFSFSFWWCLFLFVLLERRRREEPQRQPAKGVNSAGLSNDFADMDSCNCCLLLPFQEQPIRWQVLKVKTVQAGNLWPVQGCRRNPVPMHVFSY